MYDSVQIFRNADEINLASKLLKMYKKHVDYIVECGQNYPESEVAYEQSIVAPAAKYVSDMYRLTKENKYKIEAQAQFYALDQFQGFQPDYHLNEVAIRHWDGYWFGKYKQLGDTFPHYWTALSGLAFLDSDEVLTTSDYSNRAQKSLKSTLSLFHRDGSASCAMIYPYYVNQIKTHFMDPWANDQDWGLYYVLKNNNF